MLNLNHTYAATIQVHRSVSRADASAVLAALAGREGAVVFESSAEHELWGRYTVAACRPLHVTTLRDGCLSDSGEAIAGETAMPGRPGVPGVYWPGGAVESFTSALRRLLTCVKADAVDGCDYVPGWMGYLGYEVGRHFERLPGRAGRDTVQPDMHLAFYDAVAVCDRLTGEWDIMSLRFDDPPAGAGLAERELLDVFAQSEQDGPGEPIRPLSPSEMESALAPEMLTGDFTPAAYRKAVARCVEYIAAGDIFQVNLSQRFTRPTSASPLQMYRHLRANNPAWYSGYLAGDGWAVLSSSPELFLRCRRGHVVTRPIKGTRRRTGISDLDAKAAAELLASAKDNAELAMIIDLLRNDLGRVCTFGTVRVTDPRALETHPTVFHLVGTVEGDLDSRADLADLVAATFPGGSITGAPKIRAMEIIDELEPCARGAYTGSMVHFGVDASAEMNIVIRTAVWAGDRVHVHVGGGIVADSTAEGEYVETLDKARAVLAAVAAADRK